MVTYITRAAIGLVAPTNRTLLVPAQVENFAWHYPGMAAPIDARGDAGLARVKAALRGWQTYHMKTRGWSDIAYCAAVDQVGRAYTLRGLPVKSAANGGTTVNEEFGAALLIIGNDEEPSELMKATARQVAVDYRKLFSRIPRRPTWHGAIRPGGTASDPSTSCPGQHAINDIKAGEFDAPLPPVPTTPTTPTEPKELFTVAQYDDIMAAIGKVQTSVDGLRIEEAGRYKVGSDRYVAYMAKFQQVLNAIAADDANDVTEADVQKILDELAKLEEV